MSQVKYSSSARGCFSSVKFALRIIIRCHFAFLSIDIFVFFTRYSLRYLSLKLYISFIEFWLLYKVIMAFAFVQK